MLGDVHSTWNKFFFILFYIPAVINEFLMFYA